jgi:hypothetical protein
MLTGQWADYGKSIVLNGQLADNNLWIIIIVHTGQCADNK